MDLDLWDCLGRVAKFQRIDLFNYSHSREGKTPSYYCLSSLSLFCSVLPVKSRENILAYVTNIYNNTGRAWVYLPLALPEKIL